MPIPFDPEGRWWVNVSAANPDLVDRFRPTLLAFLAFGSDREPNFVGSGFFTAATPDLALAITAKHVLPDGVHAVQRPSPRHAPSALFVPVSAKTPSLHPEKLKAVWMGSKFADMLNVIHAGFNEVLDLACCIVERQEHSTQLFQPASIPIDTAVPSVGGVVHMVSADELSVTEVHPPFDGTTVGQAININRRISVRIGVVTGVYPNGFRQYRWPCFTTSIPAEAGMSGGFVYMPRDGQTIAACGIVCADNTVRPTSINPMECGESVIACAWTALCLHAPAYLNPDAKTRTIYEMMRVGDMDLAVGGIDNFEIIDEGDGKCRLRHR